MTGLILNVINGVLKLVNSVLKIAMFLVENIVFTFYRGIGELLESGLEAGNLLISGRVIR